MKARIDACRRAALLYLFQESGASLTLVRCTGRSRFLHPVPGTIRCPASSARTLSAASTEDPQPRDHLGPIFAVPIAAVRQRGKQVMDKFSLHRKLTNIIYL